MYTVPEDVQLLQMEVKLIETESEIVLGGRPEK